MTMTRRVLPFAALVLLLVGCQPLPHPFEDDHAPPGAPILTVPDTVGIVVEPVTGTHAETGTAIAAAMVSALKIIEVPATTGPGNKFSYHLTGTAVAPTGKATKADFEIDWTLTAADGTKAGQHHQLVTLAQAGRIDAKTIDDMATAEAPKIAGLIQDTSTAEHQPIHQIYVRKVEGAPGDGNAALPSALTYLLKRQGLTVVTDPQTPNTITVAGTIAVAPVAANQQHVQIVWHVLKPDGSDFGQVSQENNVPNGALDGRWGEIAMAVALAGVDDIVHLVETVPPA
jgi:hypothetical protein